MSDWLYNILLFPMAFFLFLVSQIFQIAVVNYNWEIGYDVEMKIYSVFIFLAGLGLAIWFIIDNWR